MKKLRTVSLIFCLIISLSLVFSGCNNKSASTPDEVYTSAEASTAEKLTSAVPLSTEVPVTEIKTEAETEPVTEQVYIPDYNSDVQEYEPQDPCTVNVDGKSYTVYIGDTVNYVFYLETAEALEDFQATTYYDSSMLELIDTGADKMFPVAKGAAVYNTEMQNAIKFNAVDINGMDFTNGAELVSFEFRVLDSGSVAISTTLEYMDSVLSEPYVDDFRIVGDINYSEEIK